MLLSFCGITGLVMDVGRAYLAHAQLQNAANAAALAAAGQVYNTSSTTNATTYADTYSATTSDDNADSSPMFQSVSTSVTTKCLNLLQPKGATCTTGSAANAVQVTETASIKTYFMPIVFGPNTMSMSATATSSMSGLAQSWNVAIIIDATDSMVTNTDTTCGFGGTPTRFTCELEGIQALLQSVDPCKAGFSSCTTSNSLFRVALFAFPNVTTATRPYDWGCNGTKPTPEPYTLPEPGLSSYDVLTYTESGNAITATYEVTMPGDGNADANGFLSDYMTSGALNTSSILVKAIGGSSSCTAMNTAGGESTYYGGVIYAAQNALTAEAKLYSGSSNAIIMLSDGEANADSSKFPFGDTVSPSADGYNTQTSNGTYPSAIDQCQQAILAAQAAATAGTRVYAVAYGSESSGCSTSNGGTDSTTIATGTNQSFTWQTITPCIAMENIASSLNWFFSDKNQSGSGSTCQDNSHTAQSMAEIFGGGIPATFTSPRLLPNNAT
jgi:Flp pilus assembly protein TadG